MVLMPIDGEVWAIFLEMCDKTLPFRAREQNQVEANFQKASQRPVPILVKEEPDLVKVRRLVRTEVRMIDDPDAAADRVSWRAISCTQGKMDPGHCLSQFVCLSPSSPLLNRRAVSAISRRRRSTLPLTLSSDQRPSSCRSPAGTPVRISIP